MTLNNMPLTINRKGKKILNPLINMSNSKLKNDYNIDIKDIINKNFIKRRQMSRIIKKNSIDF